MNQNKDDNRNAFNDHVTKREIGSIKHRNLESEYSKSERGQGFYRPGNGTPPEQGSGGAKR